MPEHRLLALITAALMLGPSQTLGQQAASLQELYTLERLISGKDCGALHSFVSSRGYLISGSDALSQELQKFMRDVETGRLDCFTTAALAPRPATPLPPSRGQTGQLPASANVNDQFRDIY